MAYTTNDVDVGDRVAVRTWEGRVVRGTVDDVDLEGKNGYPVIGYETDDGEGYWAYFDQIVSVTKK